MLARFYSFSKKLNSTKRPLTTDGTAVDITLKHSTSVLKPQIRLLWSGTGNPTAWNYVELPELVASWHNAAGDRTLTGSRYYWINDWTYEDRQWIASCEIDVLATWKGAIGLMSKYVLRSAAQYNAFIPDGMYTIEAGCTTTKITQSSPLWASSFTGGRFIVGIVGQGNTYNVGGVGYVVCTPQQLKDLLNAAFTGADALWPSTLGSASDIGQVLAAYGEKLQQSMSNPYQFINSVLWVPFVPTTDGTVSVTLGYISTGIAAGALSAATFVKGWAYTLPNPLDVSDYWKCIAPYRKIVLMEQAFGTFELDTVKLLMAEQLACVCVVDVVTGSAVLECTARRGGVQMPALFRTTASLGVQIPISGQMVNVANGITQALGAAESTVGLFTGRGSITGTASAIMSAAEAFMPEAVGGGNVSGNLACFDASIESALYVYDFDTIEINVAEKGRPLCAIRQLNTLAGYQMLADGHLENVMGYDEELTQLQSFLEGGYFYE